MTVRILLGDCLQKLQLLEANSVHAIVTDPPYGLSFMGKKWDYDVPSTAIWQQCLRVLKPGGHLLAFAGTRTQHRMAVRIEDAGFEIRDMIAWVYGSGFPKSHDVSKAIDKMAGAEREKVPATGGLHANANLNDDGWSKIGQVSPLMDGPTPATEDAKRWQGWGTALKPALEPITVARKPLCGTVAENVLAHGCGGLNVDGCRVAGEMGPDRADGKPRRTDNTKYGKANETINPQSPLGRWPANLIHDGSDEVVRLFPESKSCNSASTAKPEGAIFGGARSQGAIYPGEYGSAARFFYCAKASKKDRGEGNNHPTVKPTDLMRYLCRLVCPPDGTVLDPFMGSGSTGVAATLEKLNFIGIELLREHFETSKRRIIQAKGKQ